MEVISYKKDSGRKCRGRKKVTKDRKINQDASHKRQKNKGKKDGENGRN